MTVKMHPPVNASGHIHSIGVDEENGGVHIRFHKGGQTYHYPGVPLHVAKALHTAESAGEFFHANIKGRYDHRKVR